MYTKKKNLTNKRCKFKTRKQHYNESNDEFVTSLKCLAASCYFVALNELLITDRVQDQRLREIFRRESDLNLRKAIDVAKATESGYFESKAFKNESKEINRIKQDSQFIKQNKNVYCLYCGISHVMNREKCPAFGRICFKCKKHIQFANVCRATVSNEVECKGHRFISSVTWYYVDNCLRWLICLSCDFLWSEYLR